MRRVEMGSRREVERLRPEVELIVSAVSAVMGISSVYVSDETYLSDFGPDAAELREIGDRIGLSIDPGLSLVELAAQLRYLRPVAPGRD